ncbi:aldo/keto reductase [Cellulosimicrobium sp. NPDC055967]|uniref:aldo/keto reductase n=1 Tax=Cellulosimicrobium sp. NPDC055967 TaxID=3345670 RepID=UPI0035D6E9C1
MTALIPAASAGPSGTRRAEIGGRTVSAVGYGAMQLGRLRQDRAAALMLVRRAFELGVDHVDTAQFYAGGWVNGLLREALRSHDGVVVATKVGVEPSEAGMRAAQRPEQLRAGVEENLRGLGVDQVSVVHLRRMDGLPIPDDQRVDVDDQLAELVQMRDEGLVGAIGLSNVSLDIVQRALPAGVASVQNNYSVVARDREDLLELTIDEKIAWVPFYPLGGTMQGAPRVTDEPVVRSAAERLELTPAQVGLAWLLHRAPNVLLIPGTASIEHLRDNLAVGDIVLDDSTLAALNSVWTDPSAARR